MKATGKIRIIAGQWRHRLLPVPRYPGLRPSSDRIRETLFNWIGGDIRDSDCLDLFAGTGALGFEAASRGAARVWMVESVASLCRNLRDQCELLKADQVQVVHSDALAWVTTARQAMDYIFLDPPFGDYDLRELLDRLEDSSLIKATTALYFECAQESGAQLNAQLANGAAGAQELWFLSHCARAGRVSYNLFQRRQSGSGCSR